VTFSPTGHADRRMESRDITPAMVPWILALPHVSWPDRDRPGWPQGERWVHQTAEFRLVLDHATEPPTIVTAARRRTE